MQHACWPGKGRRRNAQPRTSFITAKLANISGQKESEVASILSSANRDALKIEGEADAEAARIYTNAYSAPDAQDLYLFLRSLDVARSAFEHDTTAVISTNSDLGRVLKSMSGSLIPTKPGGQ